MRFILVDDESACNMISRFTIRQLNKEAEIEVFTNPEEALAYIKTTYCHENERIPTCVLLDINMPQMTGWDFLEQYKTYGAEVHKCFTTYIVSSSVDARDQEKAASCSLVDGFISKPLSLEQLEEVFKVEGPQ